MKVYLAHPHSQKNEGKRIQTEIERLGIEVINPFERGEQEIYDRKLGPDGTGLTDEDCANIVEMDLAKIDRADFVVALLLEPEKTLGTYMEIFYTGYCTGKPVIVYTPFNRLAIHPWIRYFGSVVEDESKLYEVLTTITRVAAR